MKFDLVLAKSAVHRKLVGLVVGLMTLSAAWGGVAHADPAEDALANLNELSRKAEQLTETIRTAQIELDHQLQLLAEADRKHAEDLAALEATKAQLAARQGAVDRLAAAVYMGGRPDGVNAILTAASPKTLIDKMTVQRVMSAEAFAQMDSYRMLNGEAQAIEASSAKSAADTRRAVETAAAVRKDLQAKQAQLREQIAEVADHAVLTSAPETIAAALGHTPIPTVGMSGLVPNARRLVQYIMATYPGVHSIGGVRSDPLPDHPSGHAIDLMISDMALGDAINADIQNQAARFGVVYTMWRVPAHFDHIHITVS